MNLKTVGLFLCLAMPAQAQQVSQLDYDSNRDCLRIYQSAHLAMQFRQEGRMHERRIQEELIAVHDWLSPSSAYVLVTAAFEQPRIQNPENVDPFARAFATIWELRCLNR